MTASSSSAAFDAHMALGILRVVGGLDYSHLEEIVEEEEEPKEGQQEGDATGDVAANAVAPANDNNNANGRRPASGKRGLVRPLVWSLDLFLLLYKLA